jgi:hypothetical protein
MTPVQPGWVAIPANKSDTTTNEWYHIVGWTTVEGKPHPVVAGDDCDVFPWYLQFGEDKYIVATLKEWTGE